MIYDKILLIQKHFHFELKARQVLLPQLWFWKNSEKRLFVKIYLALKFLNFRKFVYTNLSKFVICENVSGKSFSK